MFENVIKFKTNKKYIDNYPECAPITAKNNIPEWYKKLTHDIDTRTVKGCMPFLDTLTAGYILKMPVEYHIRHNTTHEGQQKSGMVSGFDKWANHSLGRNLNINFGQEEYHGADQLKGSPLVEKNKKMIFHKILNPWIIITPPGYSCLFVPPLNNSDDRFSIIPGIVDTDTFPTEINFPMVVNGDKYPTLDSTIEIGTPYVQIIPFKRESWKMKIESISDEEKEDKSIFSFKHVLHNYKKRYWSKKTWK